MAIEILRSEYAETRRDDRQAQSTIVALLGTQLAISAAILVVLQLETNCSIEAGAGVCIDLADPYWALIPIAPIALLAMIVQQSTATLIRRYYLRAIERKLVEVSSLGLALGPLIAKGGTIERPPSHRIDDDAGDDIFFPVSTHLLQVITSPNRASFFFRVLNLLLYCALVLVVALLAAASLLQIDSNALAIGSTLGYFFIGVVVAASLYQSVAGRRNLWARARQELEKRLAVPLYGSKD